MEKIQLYRPVPPAAAEVLKSAEESKLAEVLKSAEESKPAEGSKTAEEPKLASADASAILSLYFVSFFLQIRGRCGMINKARQKRKSGRFLYWIYER